MGKSSKVTIGYRYEMGLHMGLNYGEVDEITHITVGDRDVFNGSITSNSTITIDKPDLFGGDESEGGIQGTLDVMFGAPDQAPSSKLAAMVGHAVSAFRKRTTMLFDGMVCALSKYPKPWAIRRNRRLKGWDGGVWYPEKAAINLPGGIKAMNPAHIIYEALTNRDWGDKKPRSKLDDVAFRAAADRYYAEGFGLCIQYTHQSPIKDFIYDVQNHVGANVFQSPTTGLWTIRSVRDDYDVNTLPLFTPGNGLLGIDDDDNAATVTATNEIIVLFTRVAENKEGQVRLQNAAGIRGAGGVISETVSYSGIPTPELAMRVAQRDLRAKYSAKKYKVRLNRRAYSLEEGGVFRVSDPARGLQNLVLRIGKMDYGTLNSGTITVSAVLDVFGLPANSYVAPQPSTYTPPSYEPEPVTGRVIGEATYRDLVRTLRASDIAALTPGSNLLTAMGAAPTGMSLSFELETRVGTGNWSSVNGDFCPSAILSTAIAKGIVPVTISMTNLLGGSVIELGSACVIDAEIFRVDAINIAAQTATLARGCVDTVPAAHAAGAPVLFYQDYVGVDRTEYAVGVTVQARLRTRTGAGLLAAADAPIDSYVMTRRRDRPYPPGFLRFNGAVYPAVIQGLLLLEWAHRNKSLQADQLIDQSINSVSADTSVVYRVRVTGEGGMSVADVATTSTVFSLSMDQEFSSGVKAASALRDLTVSSIGISDNIVEPNIRNKEVVRVDTGWVRSRFGLTWAADYIDGTTGAITSRTRTDFVNYTRAQLFSIKPGVYNVEYQVGANNIITYYDPYVGYATVTPVGGGANAGYAWDRLSGDVMLRDRRPGAKTIIQVTSRESELSYQANNFWERRSLVRSQLRVHSVAKTAVRDGPLSSTSFVVNSCDFYFANMAQFNSASGSFAFTVPPCSSRIGTTYMLSNGYSYYHRIAIIFGNLAYIPCAVSATTSSTSGKTLDITNILTAHLTITNSLVESTAVYSIDLDGNMSFIAMRAGLVFADQVSTITGVEITNGSIRTVNSSSGALGAVIANLPTGVLVMRVVGDLASETFYVLGSNYRVYRYDLTGALLAEILLPDKYTSTSPQWLTGIVGSLQMEITQGYLYVMPNVSFSGGLVTTYRVQKDLSSFVPMQLGLVDAGVNHNILVSSRYNSPLIFTGRLLDENIVGVQSSTAPRARINDALNIEVLSQVGTLDSHQKHSHAVIRKGWGMRWGRSWGGG